MRSGGARGERKAPERSQFARVLVVDRLLLRANEGGIERENEPNFRPPGRGAGREESGEWRENNSQSLAGFDGCRNSAFPIHFYTIYGPSVQHMDTRGKGGGPRRFTAIVLNVSTRRFGGPAGVEPQSPGERNGRVKYKFRSMTQ